MFWRKKVQVDKLIVPEHITIDIKLDNNTNEILSLFRIFLSNYLTGKENDLKKLKIDLMRPLIEQNWDKNNAEIADRINKALNSKGEKIRKAWESYKEDLLVLEKQKKNTDLVKAKLEVLDKLMEGIE